MHGTKEIKISVTPSINRSYHLISLHMFMYMPSPSTRYFRGSRKQYSKIFYIWVVRLKRTEEVASIITIGFWRRVLQGPLAWFLLCLNFQLSLIVYLGFIKSDHHYSQRLSLIVLPFALNRSGQSDGKSIYCVHVSNISTQKREKPNLHSCSSAFFIFSTPLYHSNINYSHF